MQFRVTKRVSDASRVPTALVPLPALAVPAAPTQTFAFGLGADAMGLRTRWTINGQPYDHMRVDATVELGSVQRWRLVNTSTITHYIHLHEEAWRTVTRNGLAPPAWEAGYQDVWRLDPGDVVEVAGRMTDYLGPFLIHCHMLDHEDHGMMATFQVVKPGTASRAPLAAAHHSPAAASSRRSLSAIAAASLCRQKPLAL
jgi:FtsP/CotA-like multicopper oxidase with cupredoxin domain